MRELKIKASEIVLTVRERLSRYIITHRGRPVAAFVPIEEIIAETIEMSISQIISPALLLPEVASAIRRGR
jgi:prevent-host-death family protein